MRVCCQCDKVYCSISPICSFAEQKKKKKKKMRNSSYDHDSSSSSHSHREPHHVRHLRQDSQGSGSSSRFAHISTQTSCPSSSTASSSSSSSSSLASSWLLSFFSKAHVQCSRLWPLPMLPKRYLRLGILACLLVSTVLVYVTLFRHPPPEQLLKMNGGRKDFNLRAVFGKVEPSSSDSSRNGPPRGSRRDLPHPLRYDKGSHSRHADAVVEIDIDDDHDGGGGGRADVEEKEEEAEKEEAKKGGKYAYKDVSGHRREDEANFWAMLEKDEKKDPGSPPAGNLEAGESQAAGMKVGGKRPARMEGGGRPERPGEVGDDKKEVEEKEESGDPGGNLVGKDAWDKFIVDNHHTVVGIVLDACEGPREQLGTVIMLPDEENGGVKTRTYYNFTLQEDLSEGTFSIEIKYNGQGLYDNYWDICQMEDDLEPANRTFSCPIRKGRQHLVKDKHVPSYLPKGRYQSKAWVKDAKEKLLVCGFSDFVL